MFYGQRLSKSELRLQQSRSSLRSRPWSFPEQEKTVEDVKEEDNLAQEPAPEPSPGTSQISTPEVSAKPTSDLTPSDSAELTPETSPSHEVENGSRYDIWRFVDDIPALGLYFDEETGRHHLEGTFDNTMDDSIDIADSEASQRRNDRIDSAGPDVYDSKPTSILDFATNLRRSLVEDAETRTRAITQSSASANTCQKRRREPSIPCRESHSWKTEALITSHSVSVTRAEMMRIIRFHNMSRAEVSLRKEISDQERWLRLHKDEPQAPAYQVVVRRLARNERHLMAYKTRGAEWRDLPSSVKRRIMDFKSQMEWEDRKAEGNDFWHGVGRVNGLMRRASDVGEWVSISFGDA